MAMETRLSRSKFSLRLTAAKGLFGGKFMDPATGQLRKASGAIQQKLELGLGYFLGAQQRVGNVFLESNDP